MESVVSNEKESGTVHKGVLSEGEGGALEKRSKLPNLRGCPLWTVPQSLILW